MLNKVEQIQFLKDLQKQMQYENEHDYDSQASPRFWVIMDYRIVPGAPDYDDGHTAYFHNDGDHTEFKKFEELKDFLEEYYEEEIEEDADLKMLIQNGDFDNLWEHLEENMNENGYFSSCFVKEESFIVKDTMFLTKEEAKSHLKLNNYHYSSKAHTYAMTAWRAPKVKRLLDILAEFDWDAVEIKEEIKHVE